MGVKKYRFKKGDWVFEIERKNKRESLLEIYFGKIEKPKALHISGLVTVNANIVYGFENCKTLRGTGLIDIHYRLATEREIKETKIKDIFGV